MTVQQPTAAEIAEIEATVQEAVAAAQEAAAEAMQNGQISATEAREMAREIRASMQEARDQAREARENAETREAGEGGADGQNFNIRFGDEGLIIQTTDGAGNTVQRPFDPSNLIPPQTTDILLIGVLGVIGMIMAFPIGRAIGRYIDRRGTKSPVGDDVGKRLVAIEQAVDAVAIEMERMSEANRFTTKLLTEHVAAPEFETARQGAGAAQPVAPRG